MSGPVLEVLSGDLQGKAYQVDEGEFLIGRAPSCHLVLPKRYISREHARITHDSGDQFVVDSLSHKNPVRVGDRPVREHVLADGDEFELCGIRFRFRRRGATPEARPRPAPVVMSTGSGHERGRNDLPTPDPDEAPAPRGRGSARVEESDSDDRRASARDLDPPTPDPDARPAPTARRSAAAPPHQDEDEQEQTKAVSMPSSQGSKRSGEDVKDRTSELKAAADPDDPDYDPFADVGPMQPKGKKADPGREKLLKLLTWVGLLAIAGSGAILWQISKPGEWKVIRYQEGTPVVVRMDEPTLFTVDWTPDDPPSGRSATLTSGEQELFWADTIVNVEWLCPHVDARSVFMVTAKDPGDTRLELVFEKSHRRLIVDIQVENESVHEGGRTRRRELLSKQNDLNALRQLCDTATATGEQATNERSVPGKEANYRIALVEFMKATDMAMAVRDVLAHQGPVPPEDSQKVSQCEEREAQARRDWEDFVVRQVALYRDSLGKTDWNEKVAALRRALRSISHECDPDFVRLKMILEEVFKTPWEVTGPHKCELR